MKNGLFRILSSEELRRWIVGGKWGRQFYDFHFFLDFRYFFQDLKTSESEAENRKYQKSKIKKIYRKQKKSKKCCNKFLVQTKIENIKMEFFCKNNIGK